MRKLIVMGVAAAAVIGVGATAFKGEDQYRVKVLLASATNMVDGGTVEVRGFRAGHVANMSVKDGKALVELALDKKFAPLHDGAKITIGWKALLGERIVNITDGPDANAAIPDGGMVPGKQDDPIELDQVLNALNPTTRGHVVSLVGSLDRTLSAPGSTADINQTLASAGPALEELGAVLKALGSDGPAVKKLVTRVGDLVSTVSAHDSDIRAVVDQVTHLTGVTAAQREALSAALAKLPATVDVATQTLSHVPGVVAKADPLLKDLAPVTAKLPGVARNLRPVLRDLRPVSAQLRPTLAAAAQVLRYAPGLLTTANQTVPGIDATLSYLAPVFSFLRPYTPEIAGFVSTWTSALSNYGPNGYMGRAHAEEGVTTPALNPGIPLPGVVSDPFPLPGGNIHQPWKDAFGSGVH